LRELILISSMIKFNPKHDPSWYVAIPVCQYVEKMPQINRCLRHINHESFSIDQPMERVRVFALKIHKSLATKNLMFLGPKQLSLLSASSYEFKSLLLGQTPRLGACQLEADSGCRT